MVPSRPLRIGVAQTRHRGLEAAIEPDRQDDAGTRNGHPASDLPRPASERTASPQTHACRGSGGAADLIRVLAVGRGEHHGINRLVVQDLVQIRGPKQRFLATEGIGGLPGTGMRRRETQCGAVGGAVHEISAPPAEADDRRIDHVIPL